MKPKKSGKAIKTMGRPRAFDPDEALDRALEVFWQKGYEGASLSDLTHAMGINRPSLYAAFGDKQALFRKVLDRYFNGPGAYVSEALKETSARAVAEKLLTSSANFLGSTCHPRGCLAVQSALACAEDAAPIRKDLAAARAAGEAAIHRRLRRAQAEGDLPRDSNPAALSRYLAAVMHGMSVQAASGASRKDLLLVAKTALRAWPA